MGNVIYVSLRVRYGSVKYLTDHGRSVSVLTGLQSAGMGFLPLGISYPGRKRIIGEIIDGS